MSADPVARGLAARAAAGLPRIPVALLVDGQSNERGQVDPAEAIGGVASITAYPQAYRSLRNPAFTYPIAPALTKMGGMWFRVYDDLWDWGYELHIVNNAYGSASFITDYAGQVKTWSANSVAFRAARTPIIGSVDRGFTGDLIVESGALWVAVTATTAAAMHNGVAGGLPWSPTVVDLDYTNIALGLSTGATKPDFSGATVGKQVADNQVVWKCLSATTTYLGYSFATGQIMSEGRRGLGFDPYGVIQRGYELGQAVKGVRRRFLYMANGQADAGNVASAGSSTPYNQALQNIAGYHLNRGWEALLGLTCYSPTINTANYDLLTTGVNAAVAGLQTTFPGKVYAGANLYQLMGSTGAMAAGGAYFAKDAGQDNIHLNAPGAIEAGRNIANALKAVLPQVVR